MTGYNVEVPDEDDDFDYEGESEEEESEEESVDEAPQLVNGKKRKMNDSLTARTCMQCSRPRANGTNAIIAIKKKILSSKSEHGQAY